MLGPGRALYLSSSACDGLSLPTGATVAPVAGSKPLADALFGTLAAVLSKTYDLCAAEAQKYSSAPPIIQGTAFKRITGLSRWSSFRRRRNRFSAALGANSRSHFLAVAAVALFASQLMPALDPRRTKVQDHTRAATVLVWPRGTISRASSTRDDSIRIRPQLLMRSRSMSRRLGPIASLLCLAQQQWLRRFRRITWATRVSGDLVRTT